MKFALKTKLAFLLLVSMIMGCSSDNGSIINDDNIQLGDGPTYDMVDVKVELPEGSSIDLSTASLVSLGVAAEIGSNDAASLPFNQGTTELVYLMDADDQVLLLGFITDENKEISVRTTTEAMLYFALDYYLLPESAKSTFLKNIASLPGLDDLTGAIETLFVADPLMYSKGDYKVALDELMSQISAKKSSNPENRLFLYDEANKSGLTVSKLDSANIKIQNVQPRRTKVFVYKKEVTDRNGTESAVPDYMATPIQTFDFEPGSQNQISDLDIGQPISEVIVQNSSIENASTIEPINLPVDPNTEFVAKYEVVVIGPGSPNPSARSMGDLERQAYEELSRETYVLDYFLPTLLEIGGNKALLPAFGSESENSLFQVVNPVLELYPDVLEAVYENDFKTATKEFLPVLYGDVRLSDDLRTLLKGVYEVLTNNANAPNAFVQSQELIETGYPRTKFILQTIDRNIAPKNYYQNFNAIKTGGNNMEVWTISSIDAIVEMNRKEIDVCLGDAAEIRVSLTTAYEPEEEDFEFHWSTSNNYGGRIQDINNDPSNFGAEIITNTNVVSYISSALESELDGGDNPETIYVVIYTKNKNTGELTEVGSDQMIVNNLKNCTSFFVGFTPEVEIRETENSLQCNNGTLYSLGHPTYVATFEAVEDAIGYQGRILRKDGTYGDLFDMSVDESGGVVEYRLGVGSIYVYETCSLAQAETEQQNRLDYLAEVGHQGIEVFPKF